MWLCKRDLSKECEGKYRDCTDCVLDKIRAEIADIYCGQYCENPLTADAVREMALEIIDKYTERSEDKE